MSNREITGMYPGSFDPITIAHVGIVERAANLLDRLYVAVAFNPTKNHMFDIDDRVRLVRESIGHVANAEVVCLEKGLTIDHAKKLDARTLVRGTRSVTDFLDEIQLFEQHIYLQTARGIRPGDPDFVDTQTYYALPENDHISSSFVRGLYMVEGIHNRGELIKPLVPPC
ncbi:MAG: pantetheine-phosphate adenylyltransferase, partial [Patescibacteria group bacterium]